MFITKIAAGTVLAAGLGLTGISTGVASASPTYTIVINVLSNNTVTTNVTTTHIFNLGRDSFNTTTTYNTTNNTTNNPAPRHHR